LANKSNQPDLQKITVTLPTAFLARLREHVPARQRSRFILEALEERLALEEQVAVLEETAGAWSEQNHPEMRTDEKIDRWLADSRQSWVRAR
jgi:hypothetical protein